MYRTRTREFDLMVVFLVVCVMPLAVFLMQSKAKVGRAMSLALMVLAILYVGGLSTTGCTAGGDRGRLAAVFPAPTSSSPRRYLTYLPIGADPDTIVKTRGD